MRTSYRGMALMVMLALVAGCKQSIPDSELAAKVNSQGVTKAEFEAQVERNMARYRGKDRTLPPGIEMRIKESVLRRMIDDEIIRQRAEALQVTVTDAELDTKFQDHKSRFRTEQAFQDYLTRSSNTEEQMKGDLRRNMLRDAVVSKLSGETAVSEEEVQKYYDDNKHRFVEKEQVRLSRILLRVPPNATDAERSTVRTQTQKLVGQARKDGADFGALARANSAGPEASRNGELGWMTRGRMPPDFDNAAFNLDPGGVSDVIVTKLGFEIVKVWEKKNERQRPLTEVEANIRNSLQARKRNEKRREVLRDLKKEANVEQLITFARPEVSASTPTAPSTQPAPEAARPPGDVARVPPPSQAAPNQ